MSYSLSFQGTATELRDAAADLPEHPNLTGIVEECRGASIEAATKAFDVALDLAFSGVVGDPACTFSLTLSGHANDGHRPTEGWANDCCTISLAQVSAPSDG